MSDKYAKWPYSRALPSEFVIECSNIVDSVIVRMRELGYTADMFDSAKKPENVPAFLLAVQSSGIEHEDVELCYIARIAHERFHKAYDTVNKLC